ncbi:uncharacterized protein [Clytia hemisphaerica]|uniref:PH domain-containing protein n=1 Tax=Clytia hemisphaerica TaxID=252671 RepID=A0A7M5VEL2_9CNID
MSDVCLRFPLPQLEGDFRIKLKKRRQSIAFKKGPSWHTRHLTVLLNELLISENEYAFHTGSMLHIVQLENINIYDGSNYKEWTIHIRLIEGVNFNGSTEFFIAFPSEKLFKDWMKNLQYSKDYWYKKENMPDLSKKVVSSNDNDYFKASLTLYNNISAGVIIHKNSTLKELAREVNMFCHCKICIVDRREAQLFAVDKNGKVQLLKEEEKINGYVNSGCELFLMEKTKESRLLVIFFEEEDGKESFVCGTVYHNTKAKDICQNPKNNEIPFIRGKMRSYDPQGDVTLNYVNREKDTPLGEKEKPTTFFYDGKGNWKDSTGILLIRKNKQFIEDRSRTHSMTSQEFNIYQEGREKAQKVINSQRIKDAQEALSKKEDISPSPSMGSISEAKEDTSICWGAFTDPDTCGYNFNPIMSVFESSISDDDTTSQSIEDYFGDDNDSHDLPADTNEDTTSVADMEAEAQRLDSSIKMKETGAIISTNVAANSQIENETAVENNFDAIDSADGPEESPILDAPNSPEALIKQYQDVVLTSVEHSIDEPNETREDSSQTKPQNQPKLQDPPIEVTNQPAPIISTPTAKPILIPTIKTITCELCDDYSKSKPQNISSHYVLDAITNTSQDSYICLSGVHLLKRGQQYSLQDGCEVKAGIKDTEWIDAVKIKNSVKRKLGPFTCLFVPSVRGKGYWLIRQTEDLEDSKHQPELKEPSFPPPKEVLITEPSDQVVHVSSLPQNNSSSEDEINTDENQNQTQAAVDSQRMFQSTATEMFKGALVSASDAFKNGEKYFNNVLEGRRQSTVSLLQEDKNILRDEFVLVGERFVKPLKNTVFTICTQMENVNVCQQKKLGDDFENQPIGWLVRGEFCTLIAEFLKIGLKEQTNVFKRFFAEQKPISLWDVAREFASAFKIYEFDCVLRSIKDANLRSDDERFRAFFCQLLNRSNSDGTDKLIVSFFQMLPLMTNKLEKFYHEDSFWRMSYSSGFSTLQDEIILSMRHFNGWPFELHLDFEKRFNPTIPTKREIVAAKKREEQINQDSLLMME